MRPPCSGHAPSANPRDAGRCVKCGRALDAPEADAAPRRLRTRRQLVIVRDGEALRPQLVDIVVPEEES